MAALDFAEIQESRYDRHQLITWWDQNKVSNAKVIVVGAGALGNEVLKLLALIGIGEITLIDYDRIARSNLARMVLFRETDVGKPKVQVAAKRLRELNPEVRVRPIQEDLRFALGLGEYREANLVFGCLDSVNARWALNRKCLQAGVEWIDGGISDFHGTVARYSPKEGACYECNFTTRTIERFNRRYSCPFGLIHSLAEEKVPTTAMTTSVIAALQVQQGLLQLHNLEEGLQAGQRLTLYLKPFRLVIDTLPFNPHCLSHHPLPEKVYRGEYSPHLTLQQVFAMALNYETGLTTLQLPYEFVVEFYCSNCKRRKKVLRPKEKVKQEDAPCPDCGELRTPTILSSVTGTSPLMRLTLAQLRIPPKEILEFQGNGQRIYLQLG